MTQNDLTKGPILLRIARLSLPIMATGFIQMSYQLLDMFWLGQGSTEWVAAAGMSGYVLWIANSLALIARIGTEIGVGQYTGAKNEKMLGRWIASGLVMALLGSLLYVLLLLPGSTQVIAFFAIEDPEVNRLGLQYLRIVALGIPFSFLNSVFTGIFTGAGNSRTPFILNSIGLVTNIVLDPILIFLAGWGVAGAAVATVVAQGVITLLFLYRAWRDKFGVHNAFFRIRVSAVRKIAGWGLPAALQSIFFAMVSALLSRLVAEYGAGPFAAYGVGVQIESVGWLSMMGLSSGLTAFTAQNYGAGQYERVRGGLRIGTLVGCGVGLFASILLIGFANPLMRLFVADNAEALRAGALYMIIAGLCQIPMSLDYTATGVFQGMGNTIIPSAGGILGNALRVPLAFGLRRLFGLAGIFSAIALTASLKGFVLFPLLFREFRKKGVTHKNQYKTSHE